MRPLRQPAHVTNFLLRQAVRQVFARPLLTGSLLLALAPAGHGLTLGDISVRSTLGQRLDATVPVRLGTGETLASGCVVPGRQTSDLRTVPGADVTTPQAGREGVYELQVTSATALYEPMYELELRVQCPGTPVLVRQYVLMLDLPAAVAVHEAPAYEPAVATVPATTVQPAGSARDANTAAGGLTSPPPRAPRRSAPSQPGETIQPGVRYRVMDGDTLSSIAARVRSRKVSLWTLAAAIQAANPEAFIRNDANLIKLGSEILIPAPNSPAATATAAADPAPVSAPVPTVVGSPVPATETAGPVDPVQPGLMQTQLQQTTPAQTEPEKLPRPAPSRAPVPNGIAVQKPAAVVAVDEPNPVVAAGAGIVFGLFVSAVLWMRGRRPSRKRPPATARAENTAPSPFSTTALATAITTTPAPLVTRSLEPSFTVSYTPPADDALTAEFAGEDVTSELEELFDSTDTTIQKRLNAEKTLAARSLGTEPEDGPADEDATSQASAVDIRTLAAATKDEQQAQTLLEALTLLERDYEEELTASQVLDMSAVREALGNDLDEPTQIRDTQIRAASARKRAR